MRSVRLVTHAEQGLKTLCFRLSQHVGKKQQKMRKDCSLDTWMLMNSCQVLKTNRVLNEVPAKLSLTLVSSHNHMVLYCSCTGSPAVSDDTYLTITSPPSESISLPREADNLLIKLSIIWFPARRGSGLMERWLTGCPPTINPSIPAWSPY